MDPTTAANNNLSNSSSSLQDKIKELLKKKWFLALLGIVIVLFFTVLVLLSGASKQQPVPQPHQTQPTSVPLVSPTEVLEPSQAAALQKAINEAKQSAKDYDDWQADIRTDYPWIRKLPLATEKYYVYFDINQKVFLGKLYPTATDNTEQLKTEIQNRLKTEKQIPFENYTFEWTVISH